MSWYNALKICLWFVLGLLLLGTGCYIWNAYDENESAFILYFDQVTDELALPLQTAYLRGQTPQATLPLPVYGVSTSTVVDSWGEPRGGGRSHEGVDIFAASGTPVFSATNGYVLRAGVGDLGGNYVFVVGPGGVRYYYAHLEQIATDIERGARVNRDTVLGFVGTTGNASGTPPHLHFGVYGQNGAQNPYPMLVNRW